MARQKRISDKDLPEMIRRVRELSGKGKCQYEIGRLLGIPNSMAHYLLYGCRNVGEYRKAISKKEHEYSGKLASHLQEIPSIRYGIVEVRDKKRSLLVIISDEKARDLDIEREFSSSLMKCLEVTEEEEANFRLKCEDRQLKITPMRNIESKALIRPYATIILKKSIN